MHGINTIYCIKIKSIISIDYYSNIIFTMPILKSSTNFKRYKIL